MAHIPNDLLFSQQWYLLNTGDNSKGIAGIDLNIVDNNPDNFDVWNDYSGENITIGVLDDGVDKDHEDLAANYDSEPDLTPGYNPTEGQPQSDEDNHGTAVAGVIGAVKNEIGVVGVAYNAKITAFRYKDITDNDASPIARQVAFDVSNNSWGDSSHFDTTSALEQQAFEDVVTGGRDGLGTVFVWAGGNERQDVNPNLGDESEKRGRNVNSGNYENSRYVIAVAALQPNGVFAPYSNPGAPLLVSAFGDRPASIVTTDRSDTAGYNNFEPLDNQDLDNVNYTKFFNGTSSAAPMVSGVVALILQANPNLGYRDVQQILAYSARQNDPDNSDWTINGATNWNGGGLHVNHNYGFGLIDAHAAVRLAETWGVQSTAANATIGNKEQELTATASLPSGGLEIPDDNSEGVDTEFTIDSSLDIDFVELELDIEHGQFQDLVVTLTSPDGTRSLLLDRIPYTTNPKFDAGAPDEGPEEEDPDPGNGFNETSAKYTFSSARHRGELGEGSWTLNISDNSSENDPTNKGNNIGKLNSAELRLYGDSVTNNNTYIYNNEFVYFSDDKARQTLTDSNGGFDGINAAAVRTDSTINLTPGATSILATNTLTINSNTIIEFAHAGDGNDKVTGNDVDNYLSGGRNHDTISGGNGRDQLYGNQGKDLVYGNKGDDFIIGGKDNDSLWGGQENDEIFGDLDNDWISGDIGNDSVNGNQGNDTVFGGQGSDIVRGGKGDDLVHGGKGRDQIFGDLGNDVLYGDLGADTLTGGEGNDQFAIGRVAVGITQTTGGSTLTDADIIVDFQDGVDVINFVGGITFSDLLITQGSDANVADTLIQDKATNEFLAILRGVNSSLVTLADFINT